MRSNRSLNIRELHCEEWKVFQSRIADLEKGTSYPLGEDRFEIDHGADYFAFFTRLGQLHYYVVLDGERVVAVAAAILRRVPPANREKPKTVWYLCDLKVHPEYRGRYIPVSIFVHAFPKLYPRCARGYAVSMDADSERPNRVALMLKRFPLAPMSIATRLGIISLDAKQMREIEPVLRKHFGGVSYLSLAGKKDIILQSTGSPMPLLHVQFGPCAEQGFTEPLEGYVHMFCVSVDHPLLEVLRSQGVYPSATATVVHHRMEKWDWEFILTSDI
ncbi:hypothetical protein C6503_13520 [Candidatus Poribacteria bacterium]|nr:MAG: hypothetical protein C6503_13520 [Candidatus Poribacteria bacterium]